MPTELPKVLVHEAMPAGCFALISGRKAVVLMPDGRLEHVTLEPGTWLPAEALR